MRILGLIDGTVDRYDRPFFGFMGHFTGSATTPTGGGVWDIIKHHMHYEKRTKERNKC